MALLALRLLAVCLIEPAVECVLLHVDDFVELPFQVVEDGRQVEPVELLAALMAELLEEVAEALHAVAHGIAHAPLQQVAERVLQVTEVHQVVGEVIQDVVRFERRDFLGTIPHRIAIAQCHETSAGRGMAGFGESN